MARSFSSLLRGRRVSAWGALVPVVALAAGLLFATSGRTAQGTDLRAGEVVLVTALRNDFDALAIVAPPKALGHLRKKLHKEVEKRVVCTVNKEMSGRPIPDIEALLDGETRAEELPSV